jgi:hypothetical protein
MPASIPNVTPQLPVATRPPPSVPRRRLKHGLMDIEAVVGEEQPADFEAYRDEVLAVLGPGDVVEEDLAEVMVMCQWKLRRLWRFESAQYLLWTGRGEKRGESAWSAVTLGFISECRAGKYLQRITQWEAHLMRSYLRAEARLRLRQEERRKGRRGEGTTDDAQAQPPAGARGRAPSAPAVQPAPVPLAAAPATAAPRSGEPQPAPCPLADAEPSTRSNGRAIGEIADRRAPGARRLSGPAPGVNGGMPMAAD